MYSVTIEGITLKGSCFDDVLTRVLNKVYTTYSETRDYKLCLFDVLKSDGTPDRRFRCGVGYVRLENGRLHFYDYTRPYKRNYILKRARRFFDC